MRSMYNKTIIRFSFCDIQNNQGLGKGYHPQPTSTLIILDITKTSSNTVLLLLLLLLRSLLLLLLITIIIIIIIIILLLLLRIT